MPGKKDNDHNYVVSMARLEERFDHFEKRFDKFEEYLKSEHLSNLKERVDKLESSNEKQDKKIESNTRAMWRVQTIYTTAIVVLNLGFMVWRVFGG